MVFNAAYWDKRNAQKARQRERHAAIERLLAEIRLEFPERVAGVLFNVVHLKWIRFEWLRMTMAFSREMRKVREFNLDKPVTVSREFAIGVAIRELKECQSAK